MTQEEFFLFIMYDSAPGNQARCMFFKACLLKILSLTVSLNEKDCPHVSIENPRAAPTAPKRRSIETRCIVITKY